MNYQMIEIAEQFQDKFWMTVLDYVLKKLCLCMYVYVCVLMHREQVEQNLESFEKKKTIILK